MVELTEQQILENIIESHLKSLEFYKKQEKNNCNPAVVSELATIGSYITRYGLLTQHPNFEEYSIKLLVFTLK